MENLLILFIIILVICFFLLPISIAKNRGVSADSLSTIKGVTYLSILFPPLWLIALLASLCVGVEKVVEVVKDDSFERLEKLHSLLERKIITKEEYDNERAKILG